MLDRIFAARCQKKRLVLNLRHVNQVVRKQKFKYEDMSIAMMLFRPGEYMFTFDLKSGYNYHHVEVVQAHHKYMYLGFGFPLRRCFFNLDSTPFVNMYVLWKEGQQLTYSIDYLE